jgi:hypothetical protein
MLTVFIVFWVVGVIALIVTGRNKVSKKGKDNDDCAVAETAITLIALMMWGACMTIGGLGTCWCLLSKIGLTFWPTLALTLPISVIAILASHKLALEGMRLLSSPEAPPTLKYEVPDKVEAQR